MYVFVVRLVCVDGPLMSITGFLLNSCRSDADTHVYVLCSLTNNTLDSPNSQTFVHFFPHSFITQSHTRLLGKCTSLIHSHSLLMSQRRVKFEFRAQQHKPHSL